MVTWARKRRRHIRRDDLLGFLCGKTAPPRTRPAVLQRTCSYDRSSPRHINPFSDGLLSPDTEMQPFREALAIHGLNGAMADISVDSTSASTTSQGGIHFGRRRHGAFPDLNPVVNPEDLYNIADARKRNSSSVSSDTHVDSPPHKRGRFL